jgi:HD-like signal output (HDOD) protein
MGNATNHNAKEGASGYSMAQIFDHSHNLPNIPKVVQELIETFDNPDIDIDEIAKKIALDQVLTAKVLRLANSAHYGVSRTISSTSDAAVILGFATLRTMVMASGITGATVIPEGIDRKQFWRDNFAIAEIAKWMAKYCKGLHPETAFTCGMLHSIGDLLIHQTFPDEAKQADAQALAGASQAKAQEMLLGFNYGQVGGELAKRWKFPDEIHSAIRDHCNPLINNPINGYAGLLHLAVYIHDAHLHNMTEHQVLERFPMRIAQGIGMDTQHALEDVQETLDLESCMDALLDD